MGARTLADHHRERLTAATLTDEIIAARGYWTATKRSELRDLGFKQYQTIVPSLVIPIRGMDGQIVTYQARPDEPRIGDDGRPVKYETPGATRPALDMPIGSREALLGGRATVWITEGAIKADAGTAAGLCCVSVPGVWSWARRLSGEARTALPEFFRISWEARKVVLCFDSDVMVKPAVHGALTALAAFLTSQGAAVSYCYLPSKISSAKVGLDDYLADHSTQDLWANVRDENIEVAPAKPEHPAPPTMILLATIERFVRRFVVLPDEHEIAALCLFVLHTWSFTTSPATPYLYVRSPEKRSGKTRLLEVLDLLCREPMMAASISEAGLFQTVQAFRPTLLLDEIDATFTAKSERAEALRGVLNAGNRPRSYVVRGAADGQPVKFSTYCPKVLAGIDTGRLPDTIRDRSIVIDMERKLRSEPVERLRERDLAEGLAKLAEIFAGWAAEHAEALAAFRTEPIPEISGRLEEGWEPLLGIADLAGGDWPERAKVAAVALAAKAEEEKTGDLGHLLLVALREIFQTHHTLSTKAICAKLNDLDDFPFGAFGSGSGINGRALAGLLRPYGIRSKNVRLAFEGQAKGYERGDFEDAWARYIDVHAEPAGVPSQPSQRPAGPESPSQSQIPGTDSGTASEIYPSQENGSTKPISEDRDGGTDGTDEVQAPARASARKVTPGQMTLYDMLGEPDPAAPRPKSRKRSKVEPGLDVTTRSAKPWAGLADRDAYCAAIADWEPYRPPVVAGAEGAGEGWWDR